MIIPGTYITVLDEGLISVGAVSVGNVGVVGTATLVEEEAEEGTTPGDAAKRVYTLSSFTEARELFKPPTPKETLLKTLELLFGNGARTVYVAVAADDSIEAYKSGLALLENEPVNIVLLAGQDASRAGVGEALREHIKATETIERERIGVIGSSATADVAVLLKEADATRDDHGRILFVGPGIRLVRRDPIKGEEVEEQLSGAYTAAAVAGLISSLPPHISPTNKTLVVGGLGARFNHGQLEKLVANNVLVIERREGYRVVRGVTTSSNAAWRQVTTRRIVDKALFGTRSACNPYIGKLNNPRVRGAMKATLDGFLTSMIDEESLRAYRLDVSATRQQEIAGKCVVTMSLQPTFCIDYVVVTMYLG